MTTISSDEEMDRPDVQKPRLLYVILTGIFLATLPCYCTGAMLIAWHQDATPTATPNLVPSVTATLWQPSPTATQTLAPTFTPTPSNTPYIPPSKTMHP